MSFSSLLNCRVPKTIVFNSGEHIEIVEIEHTITGSRIYVSAIDNAGDIEFNYSVILKLTRLTEQEYCEMLLD